MHGIIKSNPIYQLEKVSNIQKIVVGCCGLKYTKIHHSSRLHLGCAHNNPHISINTRKVLENPLHFQGKVRQKDNSIK